MERISDLAKRLEPFFANQFPAAVVSNQSRIERYPVGGGTISSYAITEGGFLAAMSDANPGDNILVPSGTIAMTQQVTIPNGVSVFGAGMDQTVFDFSSAGTTFPNISMLYTSGTVTALPNLAVAVTHGTTSLTFASNPSLAADDVLLINDSTAWVSWAGSPAGYRAGEFVKVGAASTTDITLDAPTYDSYGTADVTMYKMTPVRAAFRDFSVICKPSVNYYGLYIGWGRGCLVENVRVNGSRQAGIALENCFESSVRGCIANDYQALVALNYGITLNDCQRIIVTGCQATSGRHALDMTYHSRAIGSIPNRAIVVADCNFTGMGTSVGDNSVGTHTNTENVLFDNCIMSNGIALGGDNITVQNCHIRCHGFTDGATEAGGIGVYLPRTLGPNITIRNNTFVSEMDTASTRGVIHIIYQEGLARTGTTLIQGNKIYGNSFQVDPICIRAAFSSDISVVVSDNEIYCDGSSSSLIVECTSGYTLGYVSIRDNKLNGCRILARRCQTYQTEIVNNSVVDSPLQGIYNQQDSGAALRTREDIVISGNVVNRSASTGIRIEGQSQTFSDARVTGNIVTDSLTGGPTGSSATDASAYLFTFRQLIHENNIYGQSTPAHFAQRNYTVSTITLVKDGNNSNIGPNLGVTETSITSTPGRHDYQAKNKIGRAGATPSTGTYEAGDILWATAPASSQAGRICTTAGTYGTLAGVTGSIKSADRALVVNSRTGLSNGIYITIAGVSGAKYIINTPTALASTTVNGGSNSGQKVLNIASVANLLPGEWIVINRGGAREETKQIASVGTSSVTLTANLASTHAASDADTVENAVYLNSAADATVTAAAVGYQSPAFQFIPYYNNGTAGVALNNSQFLVLAANTNLSAERVLTPGALLTGTDAGAGSAYTVAVDATKLAWSSGKFTIAGGTIALTSNGNFAGTIPSSGTIAVYNNAGTFTAVQTFGASSTGYSQFEADGTYKMAGSATVFRDWNTSVISAKVPAVNDPEWAAFSGNIYAYQFAVNDYVNLNSIEFNHEWKEGSTVELHAHWGVKTSNVDERRVKWEIEYSWGNMGGTFITPVVITGEGTIAAGEATPYHHYTSIGTLDMTGGSIGAALVWRIRRIASSGTAPTTDPFLLQVGVHYEMDTLGSRQRATK